MINSLPTAVVLGEPGRDRLRVIDGLDWTDGAIWLKTSQGRTAASAQRSNRTALLVWAIGPALELPGVALLCSVSSTVADDAAFGSPGSQVVLGLTLLVTLAAVVVAWQPDGVPRGLRQATVLLLSVAVGLVLALLLGFFIGSDQVGVGILLAHCALAMAMIARYVNRPISKTATSGPDTARQP